MTLKLGEGHQNDLVYKPKRNYQCLTDVEVSRKTGILPTSHMCKNYEKFELERVSIYQEKLLSSFWCQCDLEIRRVTHKMCESSSLRALVQCFTFSYFMCGVQQKKKHYVKVWGIERQMDSLRLIIKLFVYTTFSFQEVCAEVCVCVEREREGECVWLCTVIEVCLERERYTHTYTQW